VFVILPMPPYLSHLPALNPCMLKSTPSFKDQFLAIWARFCRPVARKFRCASFSRLWARKSQPLFRHGSFPLMGRGEGFTLILFPHPSPPNRSPRPLLRVALPTAPSSRALAAGALSLAAHLSGAPTSPHGSWYFPPSPSL
jgi:hypothetical protein